MDETPGEPPEEGSDSPDEPQLPQQPPLPEEPYGGDEAGEHEAAASEDADEHQTQEETELPGELDGLQDTQYHELADEEFPYQSLEETDYEALEEYVHTPEELRQRRAEERAARRRVGRQRLLVLILGVIVLVVVIVIATSGGGGPKTSTGNSGVSKLLATGGAAGGSLQPGYSPSALPGNILVADENNKRVVAITPAGQIVWQTTLTEPSAAFPSTTAKSVLVTEHSHFEVLQVSVNNGKILYHYGRGGVSGSGADRLHDPNTAQFLANKRILIADKSNCRVLMVLPPSHHNVKALGHAGDCAHNPPHSLRYPTSAFPTPDGGLVVTEVDPGWVDLLSGTDTLVKAIKLPILTSPEGANETSSGDLIAVNHTHPGAVVEFTTAGKVLWTYDPKSGAGELYNPTLAEVLPDGNVLVSDSRNDRVIVIDQSTKKIIWQYGYTGKPAAAGGYLHTPDSAVLVSP
jgi:outer membrane protein assembly factor BamB